MRRVEPPGCVCDGDCRAVVCYFFFSSRRRHTRLVSDWSSDVCSSDLAWAAAKARNLGGSSALACFMRSVACWRSEERRVGKECGLRGAEEHKKKNKKDTR